MDIVEFLTARENEREQETREAGPYWRRKAASADDDPGVMVMDDDHSYPLVVNPAWVLADIAAKRALIALHDLEIEERLPRFNPTTGERIGVEYNIDCAVCGWASFHPNGGCTTLLLLAQPYADHPDFDPSWRIETPVR